MIYEQNPDFSPVIRIDGSGGVEHGHARGDRQAGTRPHLALEARRDFHSDSRGNQRPLPRRQGDSRVRRQSCNKIDAGGVFGLIRGKRKILAMRKPPYFNNSHFVLSSISQITSTNFSATASLLICGHVVTFSRSTI